MLSPINQNYIPQKTLPVQPGVGIKQEMTKNLDRHTLAVYKNGKIKYYEQRNLKPIFLALEEHNNDLSGAYIVDRRISKASAMLFAYGKAKYIKTPLH